MLRIHDSGLQAINSYFVSVSKPKVKRAGNFIFPASNSRGIKWACFYNFYTLCRLSHCLAIIPNIRLLITSEYELL